MAVGLLATTGLLIYFKFEQKRRQLLSIQKHNQGIGKPKLGGPFSLVNQNGSPVSDRDFHGYFKLLYFGFTNCPDICPTELTKITDALNLLEKKYHIKEPILPIFITVDPKRDSIAKMRDYIAQFHEKMIGLTGTPQQISKVAREYRVYFNSMSQGNYDDKEYVVDHSIITYLVDPNGEFVNYFGQNVSAEEMAGRLKEYIEKSRE
jgi:protein SCO1/2